MGGCLLAGLLAYGYVGLGRIIAVICFALAVGLFLASTVCLVIWWVRYPRIRTDDIDYQRAKRSIIGSSVLWLILAVLFLGPFLLSVFFPSK